MSRDAAILMTNRLESHLIALAARRAGFQPLLCGDAEQLRETLAHQPPAVLLLDVHLVGENGLRLLETLRSEGQLNATAVLLFSTACFPQVVQRAAAAGAKEFIVKPVDTDALVERLQKFLA